MEYVATNNGPALTLGKAVRFAPGRKGQPATQIWKIWAEGSEVYALSRNAGSVAKISVHESGQIHMRLEAKDKQLLAPPLSLSSGLWLHAFELRFLLAPGAGQPGRKMHGGATALLVDTPPGTVLVTNLVVGAPDCPADAPPPAELTPAVALWRTTLRNGRPATLLARVLPIDEQNAEAMRDIKEVIAPKVNFDKQPVNPYIEITRLHWHPQGGNVILVIPMGNESVRVLGDRPLSDAAVAKSRAAVDVISPPAFATISAPNGAKVAMISLGGATTRVELERDKEIECGLGPVTLSIDPQTLIAGSKFQAQPIRLACAPRVDGVSPRTWEYTVVSSFDGHTLVAELRQLSTGLRKDNSPGCMPNVLDGDEIVMSVPRSTLKLIATLSAPTADSELIGRFILRES